MAAAAAARVAVVPPGVPPAADGNGAHAVPNRHGVPPVAPRVGPVAGEQVLPLTAGRARVCPMLWGRGGGDSWKEEVVFVSLAKSTLSCRVCLRCASVRSR